MCSTANQQWVPHSVDLSGQDSKNCPINGKLLCNVTTKQIICYCCYCVYSSFFSVCGIICKFVCTELLCTLIGMHFAPSVQLKLFSRTTVARMKWQRKYSSVGIVLLELFVFLYCILASPSVPRAPCGLRGCKNRPAPFPGRMS